METFNFSTCVVQFTFFRFCEIIDTDAFDVKLAVKGTFFETDVWNLSDQVTDQFVVFHGLKTATKLSSLEMQYKKKTGHH